MLSPLPGAATRVLETTGATLAIVHHARAPTSVATDDHGAAVAAGIGLDAARCLADWRTGRRVEFSGFGAVLLWDEARGLFAAADRLGFFPLCYAEERETLLVSSAAAVFRLHPLFPRRLDRLGLAGLLRTNGFVAGRTLDEGVRRLGPGATLIGVPGARCREEAAPWLLDGVPPATASSASPAAARQLGEIMAEAFAALAEPSLHGERDYAASLSGGIDSRMMVGLAVDRGIRPHVATSGLATDMEVRCAGAVARRLALPFERVDERLHEFAVFGARQAALDGGASGFGLGGIWAFAEHAAAGPPRMLNGYGVDRAVGGTGPLSADSTSARRSRDALEAWGLSASDVAALFGPGDGPDLVATLDATLDDAFEAGGRTPDERAIAFEWAHRVRYQAGAVLHPISFGSWPVQPLLSSSVLAAVLGLGPAALRGRGLQKALLCLRWPHLARLPLDRNGWDDTPLLPRPWHRWLRKWKKRRARRAANRPERRRYYRIYDLNGAHWLPLREQEVDRRASLPSPLDAATIAHLLPAPPAPLPYTHDAIIETSGARTLLGYLLWNAHSQT